MKIDFQRAPADEPATELLVKNGRTLFLVVYGDQGERVEYPIKPAVEPAGEDVDG